MEERGLRPETVRRFRLGVVAEPGETDEPAEGRISIPFTTPTGVVALRFRAMPGQTGPKYWQPSGTDVGIFNTPAIAAGGRRLMVLEGEFDAMVACQMGFPAVGYPGANSWKSWHREVYEGFESVTVIGDNDETPKPNKDGSPGTMASTKFCRTVADNVPDPHIVMCPRGHDFTSAYLEYGEGPLLEMLKLDIGDFQ